MSEHWDELASAHLDGEATADEVALIQNSPEARRALDELRSIAEANADVPSPPDSVRSAHLGAAMSLFDELHTSSTGAADSVGTAQDPTAQNSTAQNSTAQVAATTIETDVPTSNVTPLRRRPPAAWLGRAAAAVVVVAGLGFTASQLDGSTDDSTTGDEVAASPSAAEELEADMLADDTAPMAAAESEESAFAEAADAGTDAASGDAGDTAASDDSATDDSATDESASDDGALEDAEASEGERSTENAVADLTATDDLLEVATILAAENLMSSDTTTEAGQLLEEIQTRCPAMFEGRGPAIAAPILFDDEFALLVFTTSPTEQAMVITTNCVILAAAG